MAIPELGSKQICPNCQAKFYDLQKRPAHCPKCEHEFDPDEAVRSRRVRARAAPIDRDLDDEAEDQVRDKNEDAEDEEEDEVATPELDAAAVDDPVIMVDEDGEPVSPPEDELAAFQEEDDLEDEDDADVPFLVEDDDDDDFDETEIDGLPGEGDVEDR